MGTVASSAGRVDLSHRDAHEHSLHRIPASTGHGNREQMRRVFAEMRRRPDGPDEGSRAPDFDLAILDGDGERVRLSDLRGQPVGLIFGSYT